MIRVLNFGSINIDHIYRVPHFVQPGETLACDNLTTVLGGKGANQSAAIAQAGVGVAHIGKISQSDQWAIETLNKLGVNTQLIETIESPSGHAIIQVDDKGENCIILNPGANHQCEIRQLETAIKQNTDARYLLIQNECNLIEDAINKATELGLQIIYNPAPMNAATLELPLHLIDVIIVNQVEGKALSGKTESSEVLDSLTKKYPEATIVLTLGSKGAIIRQNNQEYAESAHTVEVIDTTAAGDTFVGYLVAGFCEEMDISLNLKRACQAAALAVSKSGAIPSIPSLDEVSQFASK